MGHKHVSRLVRLIGAAVLVAMVAIGGAAQRGHAIPLSHGTASITLADGGGVPGPCLGCG